VRLFWFCFFIVLLAPARLTEGLADEWYIDEQQPKGRAEVKIVAYLKRSEKHGRLKVETAADDMVSAAAFLNATAY